MDRGSPGIVSPDAPLEADDLDLGMGRRQEVMMGGFRQLKGTMPKELGLEGTVEGLEGQTLFAQGIFDGKPTDPGQIALVLGPRVAGPDVEGVAFEKVPIIRRNIFFRSQNGT